jgi:hypothetical protein
VLIAPALICLALAGVYAVYARRVVAGASAEERA